MHSSTHNVLSERTFLSETPLKMSNTQALTKAIDTFSTGDTLITNANSDTGALWVSTLTHVLLLALV